MHMCTVNIKVKNIYNRDFLICDAELLFGESWVNEEDGIGTKDDWTHEVFWRQRRDSEGRRGWNWVAGGLAEEQGGESLDAVEEDTKLVGVREEDTEERIRWRERICWGHPWMDQAKWGKTLLLFGSQQSITNVQKWPTLRTLIMLKMKTWLYKDHYCYVYTYFLTWLCFLKPKLKSSHTAFWRCLCAHPMPLNPRHQRLWAFFFFFMLISLHGVRTRPHAHTQTHTDTASILSPAAQRHTPEAEGRQFGSVNTAKVVINSDKPCQMLEGKLLFWFVRADASLFHKNIHYHIWCPTAALNHGTLALDNKWEWGEAEKSLLSGHQNTMESLHNDSALMKRNAFSLIRSSNNLAGQILAGVLTHAVMKWQKARRSLPRKAGHCEPSALTR